MAPPWPHSRHTGLRGDDRLDDAALQVGGDLQAEEAEDGRRDVHQLHAGDRPARGDAGAGGDQQAVLGVVGVVGAGVVLEGVDRPAADRADRPPAQVAEVDEEVGRGRAPDGPVEVLGLEDAGADRLALGVAQGFELGDQAVAGRLVVLGRDQALRLAPLDVEEEPAVVAARPPGGRPATSRSSAPPAGTGRLGGSWRTR